jgi:hypothetical protein
MSCAVLSLLAINRQRKGPLCARNRYCYALLLRTIAVRHVA